MMTAPSYRALRRFLALACAFASTAACGPESVPSSGRQSDDAIAQGSDGAFGDQGSDAATEEATPNAVDAGLADGDAAASFHCSDPGAVLCATGDACRSASDCASDVCDASKRCAAPSPTDGVKNGDETDVDCGGALAPKCVAGKACKLHADCAKDACLPAGVCAASRSCRQHFGGDTCGVGEVGDPAAKHEDCCTSIQPDAQNFRLDKYLITAGRMRAFINDVGGNVRAWVQANRALLPAQWTTGAGAQATANIDTVKTSATYGQVTSLTLTAGGAGYTKAPIVHAYPVA